MLLCSEGIVDIRLVVGEAENKKMEEQQAINFRRGRPRYVKLVPDLRENIRLGRRDFDAVHIWYLKSRTGPFVTDLRIVKTSFLMEPVQPYMEALRKAGFSVVFRPNKIVGGACACHCWRSSPDPLTPRVLASSESSLRRPVPAACANKVPL